MDRKREFETLSATIVEGMRSVSMSLVQVAPVLYGFDGPEDVLTGASTMLDRISKRIQAVEAGQAELLSSSDDEPSRLDKASKLSAMVDILVMDTRDLSKLVLDSAKEP